MACSILPEGSREYTITARGALSWVMNTCWACRIAETSRNAVTMPKRRMALSITRRCLANAYLNEPVTGALRRPDGVTPVRDDGMGHELGGLRPVEFQSEL